MKKILTIIFILILANVAMADGVYFKLNNAAKPIAKQKLADLGITGKYTSIADWHTSPTSDYSVAYVKNIQINGVKYLLADIIKTDYPNKEITGKVFNFVKYNEAVPTPN